MKLRPYQIAALKASKEKYDSGITRQLLVLPTGMGKTVCFAALPEHHGISKRSLVLVHREELAQQAADKIQKWNPGYSVGIEMASSRAGRDDRIVVGSVQTLGWGNGRRLAQLAPDEFGPIICDEAHHSTAASYKAIFEHFGFVGDVQPKDRLLLGVTATPNRGDGAGLGAVYDEIVFNYPMLDAIRDGWLVNMRGARIRTDVSLDEVGVSYGDFKENQLARTVNTPGRNALIVSEWLKRARERQTLCFTVDIAHAIALAEAYRNAGIAAAAVWGNDPDRAYKLRAHRDGTLQVLTNCGVLTEGYDDWRISCVVMARPTKSQLLFVQMAGRGTRLPDGVDNLKEAEQAGYPLAKRDCVLLDITDNTSRHSLVTLSSVFGLPPKLDMKGKTITEAVDAIGPVAARVDLTGLEDIDKLQSYVEEVDLFSVKYPDEVLQSSQLQWHTTPAGNYFLSLPNKEAVVISRDLLDKWRVEGTVNESKFAETFPALTHAFDFADRMIKMLGRNLLSMLRRDSKAKWKKEAITDGQIKMLKWRLGMRKMPYPDFSAMNKGEANALIIKLMAGGR
jgi:superfamily II DNA or RNA helicase